MRHSMFSGGEKNLHYCYAPYRPPFIVVFFITRPTFINCYVVIVAKFIHTIGIPYFAAFWQICRSDTRVGCRHAFGGCEGILSLCHPVG
jgi:hypothetical protein